MPSINVVQQTLDRNRDFLRKRDGCVGTAVGQKKKNGEYLDEEYCIVVFVKEKKPQNQLSKDEIIPAFLDGVRTDVIETGEIKAQFTNTHRPLIGGISVGHEDITAGTLGAVVKDEDNGQMFILSNNHVLANSNKAAKGDNIVQPGPVDNGTEVVAFLDRFIPIDFGDGGGCPVTNLFVRWFNYVANVLNRNVRVSVARQEAENLVDAALGRPIVDVEQEMFQQPSAPLRVREPFPGDKVKKSGRTTGVTEGKVEYVNAEVEVNFGPQGTAKFVDQVVTTHMSEGGDSGSVVVREDDDGPSAVGLLFAGSPSVTILNRMTNVVDLLEIEF